MIVCPACSHRNLENAARCQACGASLEHFVYRECPACGSLNGADRTFCRRCLTHLTDPSAEDLAQWQELRAKVLLEASQELDTPPAPLDISIPLPDSAAETTELANALAQPEVSDSAETVTVATNLPQVVEEALVDLQNLLPIEASIALPHRAIVVSSRLPDEGARADAALFQRIATEPALSQSPSRAEATQYQRTQRAARHGGLYLAILLAALLPLLVRIWSPSKAPIPFATGALATALDALGPRDAVLLVFDYEPSYAGELEPLAEALLQALAQRGVRTTALSTRPAGVGLALKAYRAVAQVAPEYHYGEDYVILGLLAGQEAGLHALTQGLDRAFQDDYVARRPLSAWPALYGLARVDDFHHVVVFSDDDATVRRWIEQVQGRTGVPLDAWVTARIAPLLAPYHQAGQIRDLGGVSALAETLSIGDVGALAVHAGGLMAYWGIWFGVAIFALWTGRKQRHRTEA